MGEGSSRIFSIQSIVTVCTSPRFDAGTREIA